MDTATTRPSIFISYSHQDEAWKDRLVKQLRVLEREGDLVVWDDRRISAGDDWLPEIETAMAREQAAAYVIRHGMRLSKYLHAWEQEREKLLQWYEPRVMQYPASVAVTWKQTFDRLSPTPAALLRLTAFLVPDPIPFEMLEQGAEHVERAVELFCEETGRAADGKTVQEAVADLADYSMISRQDGGMVVVHRMAQEALATRLGHR